eukprot:217924-Chlamydomonas_euryale.AAC.1
MLLPAVPSRRKRWLLYPPTECPPAVFPCNHSASFTPLQWLMDIAPGLPHERLPIEVVQEPGDVVFVPGGAGQAGGRGAGRECGANGEVLCRWQGAGQMVRRGAVGEVHGG